MTKNILIALFVRKDYNTAIEVFDDVVSKTREIIRPGRSNVRYTSTKKTLFNELQKIMTNH